MKYRIVALVVASSVALSIGLATLSIICIAAVLILSESPPSPLFKPSKQSLVGEYRLPTQSVEYFEAEGYDILPHSLVLRGDGTFEMIDVPFLWGPLNRSDPPMTAYGTWTIDKDFRSRWSVLLSFDSTGPGSDQGVWSILYIRGFLPPYSVYVWKQEFVLFEFVK